MIFDKTNLSCLVIFKKRIFRLVENKKTTTNPNNKNEKCFQCAVIDPIHYDDEINNHLERMNNLKSSDDSDNRKEINFHIKSKHWKHLKRII